MSNDKIKGFFKVWDNAFGSCCDVTLAVVNDMDLLLATVAEGQEILERYKIKAIRMDFHPDAWIGSRKHDDQNGLMVTQSTFSFEHNGYVGTDDIDIANTVKAVSDLRETGVLVYSPEFAPGELMETLDEAVIEL